jgi:hypothetical protein
MSQADGVCDVHTSLILEFIYSGYNYTSYKTVFINTLPSKNYFSSLEYFDKYHYPRKWFFR